LYEELQRHDAIPLEQAQYDSDEEEEQPDFNWTPAPSLYYQRTSGNVQTSQLAPDGNKDSSNKASADILSMLVGIYGTNDLFVDEYRIMLADKLLANADFDTDKEVRNLELLKIRFGETSMRQCEIMIKDIDDSKRDSKRIASNMKGSKSEEEENNIPCIDAAIISHIFWPPLQKDSMKNHPRIQSSLDKFSMEYAKYKNPRRLVWFHQLGQVELELDVVEDDGQVVTTQFTCSPLHATLISHFEDGDGCWTSTDLANETGVPEETIKKKMGYWINQNVVRVSRNGYVSTYELISSNDEDNALDGEHIQYDDDDEGLMVSKSGQEAEELEAYESYIVGMLSNLGELSLNRIHNTLKMFVTGSEIKYNKTPQQLSVLLQRLCKEEKLECGADGMYKLLKK
jgi:anaphase-promoting complex subunit 2